VALETKESPDSDDDQTLSANAMAFLKHLEASIPAFDGTLTLLPRAHNVPQLRLLHLMTCRFTLSFGCVAGLVSSMQQQQRGAWRVFARDSTPERAELPEPWSTKLSAFHRLLLLKALRPVSFGPML